MGFFRLILVYCFLVFDTASQCGHELFDASHRPFDDAGLGLGAVFGWGEEQGPGNTVVEVGDVECSAGSHVSQARVDFRLDEVPAKPAGGHDGGPHGVVDEAVGEEPSKLGSVDGGIGVNGDHLSRLSAATSCW